MIKSTPSLLVLGSLIMLSSSLYGQRVNELDLAKHIQNRITINHDNGERETFFVSDKTVKPKADKLYYWYQSRQLNETQGGYSGKLLDGPYNKYYSNKQLAQQGLYKKGLADGWWKEWNQNHKLAQEKQWKHGQQQGECKRYDENGRLTMHGKQKDGKWNGKVWVYNVKDSTYTWQYYEDNQSISKEAYVDSKLMLRTGRFFSNTWKSIFRKKQAKEIE